MTFTVELKASGRRFDVNEGETVLDAAQRAGLALPYSCRSGLCGSCKAQVLQGKFSYPHYAPSALSPAEQASHAALLCQAVPDEDLLLQVREVRSVEDIPRRQLDVVIAEKGEVAPDVVRLLLAPAADSQPLRWLPGQYIEVLLEGGKRRAFSIARAPHLGEAIEVHVRHVTGGGFTSRVAEELKVGDQLAIEGPQGTFVPREHSERPMIMVAGGTGFAPVKALIEHFLHLDTRRIMHLYWGARSQRDLYMHDMVKDWAERVPNLDFTPVVSEPREAARAQMQQGLVHAVVLDDFPDLTDYDVYMCGPPAMINSARRGFLDARLPEDHLYFDSFEYAPDVLEKILGHRAGIHGL